MEQVISELITLAQKYAIEKVILFESRARGNYTRASDMDLAVCDGDITSFALDMEEETSTLLTFDVIDLKKNLSTEFRKSIERDGIILCEKN